MLTQIYVWEKKTDVYVYYVQNTHTPAQTPFEGEM